MKNDFLDITPDSAGILKKCQVQSGVSIARFFLLTAPKFKIHKLFFESLAKPEITIKLGFSLIP